MKDKQYISYRQKRRNYERTPEYKNYRNLRIFLRKLEKENSKCVLTPLGLMHKQFLIQEQLKIIQKLLEMKAELHIR